MLLNEVVCDTFFPLVWQRTVTSAHCPPPLFPPSFHHQEILELNLSHLSPPSLNKTLSASQKVHTHSLSFVIIFCAVSLLYMLCVFTFRRVWRTPSGLHWQSGEGEIHHESNPRQLPPWQQLQSHPFPIVSTMFQTRYQRCQYENRYWVLFT